jgi:Ras-related protein Rab-5C
MGDPIIDTWGLFRPHLKGSFEKRYKQTIGCDIGLIDIRSDYDEITFSIWDVAGSDRFTYFRPMIYRGARCAILIFDLTRAETFHPALTNYLLEIYTTLGPIPIILIGYNADKPERREVEQDVIEDLCAQMYQAEYFEIGYNTREILAALGRVAQFVLHDLEEPENFRETSFQFFRNLFCELYEVLNQMGYSVNERNEVEIITHRGIFTVNIMNSKVVFEPLKCMGCLNNACYYKTHPRKKSLCIVSGGQGYSDKAYGFTRQHLLTLAKIYAIEHDTLPAHVLNQMAEAASCPDYIDPGEHQEFIEILEIVEPVEEDPVEFPNLLEVPEPSDFEEIEILPPTEITAAEARTLLRNHRIQFYEGRLPLRVYEILKERYEQIVRGD